jgi:hypothetical protein
MAPFTLYQSKESEYYNSDDSISYKQATVAVSPSNDSSPIKTEPNEPSMPLSPLLLPFLIGLVIRLLLQWMSSNPVETPPQVSKQQPPCTQSIQPSSNQPSQSNPHLPSEKSSPTVLLVTAARPVAIANEKR